MREMMEGDCRIVLIQIDELEVVEPVDQQLVFNSRTKKHPVLGLQPHRMTAVQLFGAEFVGNQ